MDQLDAVVCGVGSGGTLTGLSRFFARTHPETELILWGTRRDPRSLDVHFPDVWTLSLASGVQKAVSLKRRCGKLKRGFGWIAPLRSPLMIRHFTRDLPWIFVFSQRDKLRMPQVIHISPFHELELSNE